MQEYFLQLVQPRVAPEATAADWGLPLNGGATAPFVVDRGWVGPAGTYIEEWSIRRGDQVLYRHPPAYIQVRGHQAVRRFSDTVRVPLALEPGTYDITFVVGKYRMGSVTVDAAPLSDLIAAAEAAVAPPPPPPPPKPRPAASAAVPASAPAAASAATPAAVVAYTGEDPAVVRKRVYDEELAKGSDPRVAEARSKSAEMRAKKAAAAAAAAPPPVALVPEPAPPAPVAPAAPEKVSVRTTIEKLAAVAPPGGGVMTDEEAARVRALVYAGAIEEGVGPAVAEARAKAAEVRARRGLWWRPDWK